MNCSDCEDTGVIRTICPDCSGNGCRFCRGKGELQFECDCEDVEEGGEDIDLIDEWEDNEDDKP